MAPGAVGEVTRILDDDVRLVAAAGAALRNARDEVGNGADQPAVVVTVREDVAGRDLPDLFRRLVFVPGAKRTGSFRRLELRPELCFVCRTIESGRGARTLRMALKAAPLFVDVGEIGYGAGERVAHPYQLTVFLAQFDRHRASTCCPMDPRMQMLVGALPSLVNPAIVRHGVRNRGLRTFTPNSL